MYSDNMEYRHRNNSIWAPNEQNYVKIISCYCSELISKEQENTDCSFENRQI